MNPLPVSVVIPTYNRRAALLRVIDSYIEQRCREVIIVDDCSDQPVEVQMTALRRDLLSGVGCQLIVIRNRRRLQQPGSRMVGAEHATQALLLFCEDDVALPQGYLHQLYEAHCQGVADIVAGPCVAVTALNQDPSLREAQGEKDIINPRFLTLDAAVTIRQPIAVPFLHTIALVPRKIVLEVPFDVGYQGNGFREETDFYIRCLEKGYRLALVPAPAALHYKGIDSLCGGQHASPTLNAFLRYEYDVLRNNYRFLKKNRSILVSIAGPRLTPALEALLYSGRRVLGWYGRLRFLIQVGSP